MLLREFFTYLYSKYLVTSKEKNINTCKLAYMLLAKPIKNI